MLPNKLTFLSSFLFLIVIFSLELSLGASEVGKYNCSFLLGRYIDVVVGMLLLSTIIVSTRTLSYAASWHLSLALILSGALSNTFMRLSYGCVHDYFVLWGLYFNISDVFISMGLILLGYLIWYHR